jgi:hypothetical protein
MSEDEIASLIQDLKRVQLEGQRIVTALKEAYASSNNTRAAFPNTPTTIPTTPTATVVPHFLPVYRTGNHVIITNKVRRPFDRPVNINDRKAIVLEVVSASRVNIKTYNGVVTRRAPKNLQHQNDE